MKIRYFADVDASRAAALQTTALGRAGRTPALPSGLGCWLLVLEKALRANSKRSRASALPRAEPLHCVRVDLGFAR